MFEGRNIFVFFQTVLDPIDNQLFLCKNLQLLDTADDYIKDLIHQINPEFEEPYAWYVFSLTC